MRNTKQRSLVFNIINNNYNHLTALEVYQECIKVIPNISLGTVYRNLNSLVSLGKIQKLEGLGQVDRFDRLDSHDHFICIQCGKIIDIDKINKMPNQTIKGNKIIDIKIRYEGICHDCLSLNKREE